MRQLIGTRAERNAFRILGAVGFCALGVLSYGYFQLVEQNRQESIARCEDSRKLISRTVLRTLNATYAQYKANPEKVLSMYERQLLGINVYRDNPLLLEGTIRRTRATLADADPARCRKVGVDKK